MVHIEAPKGRNAAAIRRYLARYVKRVAIDDARLVSATATEVTFRTRTGRCTLTIREFLRRFTQHILPQGFHKVRHYGLYASGARVALETARAAVPDAVTDDDAIETRITSAAEVCPDCGTASVFHLFPGRAVPPLSARLGPHPRGPP